MTEINLSLESNAKLINNRKVINGYDDGLYQVSPLKHKWADSLLETMQKNTWFPKEVGFADDVRDWANGTMSEQEKTLYKRSLAFVSNLDGLQTNNLVNNMMRQITSPEVSLTMVRQAWEEALHVKSYATCIEALSLDPDEIYGMYRKDMTLYKKNKYVLEAVSKISAPDFKTGTFEADQLYLEACIGNVILEGIYFYAAFLTFFNFKRNNKMKGSAEMIQFISRDENCHLNFFVKIVEAIKEENLHLWTPEFQAKIRQNIIGAVEHEIEWGLSCIGEGILGLNPSSLTAYIRHIGDLRLKEVGLEKEWYVEDPFPWVAQISGEISAETNFFEGTVRDYQVGALDWG
jgi:ribonucleoside-diphosphate reductase beta chain